MVTNDVSLDVKMLKCCVELQALSQELTALTHKLIMLEAKLANCFRLLEQSLQRLAHVALQAVLGEVKLLQSHAAVDNGYCSFAPEIVLRDFEHLELITLLESHAYALATISPKIVIVHVQMLDRLIAN